MNGMILARGGPRRRAACRALALIGLLVAACASPGSGPPTRASGPDYRVHRPPRGNVPSWAGHELSWEKLQDLGDWLEGEGQAAEGYWVVEGHLQLAEGRAHYARLEPATAVDRRSAAAAGFQRVLTHPAASASQRQRAELGLDRLSSPGARRVSSSVPPGVLPRSSWGARAATPRRLDLARAPWRWITVHHSAMPDPVPLDGGLADSARAVRRIQTAHMSGSGYGDIGYHFLIDPFGRVFQGRELRWQGAHAGGVNNVGNVGVCLLGNFEHERPTPAAVETLHGLIDELQQRLGVPEDRVRGHDDWKSTACPGRHLRLHLARYAR